MTFDVLIVCSFNVCRSPLAAALLLERLGGESAHDVTVASAGIDAVDGHAMCPTMVRMALSDGRAPLLERATLESHRSRHLTVELVRRADLVLTADRHVRSEVVKLEHGAAVRAFTLREAAQLSSQTTSAVAGCTLPDRMRAMTSALHQNRGLTELPRVTRVPLLAPPWRWPRVHAHDIPDAHQREQAPHRLVLDLAVRAADRVVARFPASTDGSPA